MHLLEQMKEDALSKNINLDENVLEKTNAQIARLNSERKLRFDLDNMKIGGCTIEDKKELGESIEDS